MSISSVADTYYAFRILRLLTTPWKKTGAYKAGLIDDSGRVVRKPKTDKEKSVYNLLHRLVFSLKRMLNKFPFGKTTIASYLAALYLIKEHTGMSDKGVTRILESFSGGIALTESATRWNLTAAGSLRAGTYLLPHDIPIIKTGELLALRDTKVTISEDIRPAGEILGNPIFKVFHPKTNSHVYVTNSNLISL